MPAGGVEEVSAGGVAEVAGAGGEGAGSAGGDALSVTGAALGVVVVVLVAAGTMAARRSPDCFLAGALPAAGAGTGTLTGGGVPTAAVTGA